MRDNITVYGIKFYRDEFCPYSYCSVFFDKSRKFTLRITSTPYTKTIWRAEFVSKKKDLYTINSFISPENAMSELLANVLYKRRGYTPRPYEYNITTNYASQYTGTITIPPSTYLNSI